MFGEVGHQRRDLAPEQPVHQALALGLHVLRPGDQRPVEVAARLAPARDAITEQVTAIDPQERVRVALYALSTAGTTHLLVRRKPHKLPIGVLTDFDLAVAAGR